MSTSDVNFYSNFGANLTKCQLLNILIYIGQYRYWGLLRYWQYQYIHSSSIVLPNMGWGRINSGPYTASFRSLFCRMPRASGDPCRAFCTKTSAGRHGWTTFSQPLLTCAYPPTCHAECILCDGSRCSSACIARNRLTCAHPHHENFPSQHKDFIGNSTIVLLFEFVLLFDPAVSSCTITR